MRTLFATYARASFGGLLLVGGLGATVASAQTQVPPEMKAQAMSLAQICKTDYERLCHAIQPGGGRILQCLTDNAGKLSPACRGALPDAHALASRAVAAGLMPK